MRSKDLKILEVDQDAGNINLLFPCCVLYIGVAASLCYKHPNNSLIINRAVAN